MANGGWYGTKEGWDRIEAPLLDADPILDDFALETGLTISKNYKDWPERSVVWGDDVRCIIQLYLVDEKDLTFNLWICASQDRERKRFWKTETPIREQRVGQFRDRLAEELREGHRKVVEWSGRAADLKFATNLK
ncbi:MAG: hypothetical protein MUO51_06025 [Woeseiaceae bacterium]|nr:hypothetical protein [Woeseiaceae bacterium]